MQGIYAWKGSGSWYSLGKKEEQSDKSVSDTKKLFTVNVLTNDEVPKLALTMNGVLAKTIIDTGSWINIISKEVVNQREHRPKLKKTNIEEFVFANNKPFTIKGKYTFIEEVFQKWLQ